jgi:protein-L-isoaspartate(D-aspartate) O-methyltransferase
MTDFAAARMAMVDTQVRPSDVTRLPIIQAMLAVPREDFVPAAMRQVAYFGEHVPLGSGRVVLDPRVFAKMLDALDLGPGDRVLDVGCGFGYSTAVIASLAGSVAAVEEDAHMAREAAVRLDAHGAGNASVEHAPLAGGLPRLGTFDAIVIEGAIETLPAAISGQLAPGGRIVAVFVDGQAGQARLGLGTPQGISWRRIFDATAPVLPGFARTKAFEF